MKWGSLPRNICDAVEKPSVPKKPMKYLDPEQASGLLTAAKGNRLHAPCVLAVTTGRRQGELLGLCWEDIEWDAGALSVQRNSTVQELQGELVIGEPMTAKSRRRVELPALAMDALRQHRKRQLSEGHPHGWVFTDTRGGPLRRSNMLTHSFKPLLKKAKLPPIRFQDLRHTAATLLLVQGVHPKVVQERLGHATISITLDTYSHVLPSMQQDAADKLDNLLSTKSK